MWCRPRSPRASFRALTQLTKSDVDARAPPPPRFRRASFPVSASRQRIYRGASGHSFSQLSGFAVGRVARRARRCAVAMPRFPQSCIPAKGCRSRQAARQPDRCNPPDTAAGKVRNRCIAPRSRYASICARRRWRLPGRRRCTCGSRCSVLRRSPRAGAVRARQMSDRAASAGRRAAAPAVELSLRRPVGID